ncbi:hypothetical protein K474DRAFT_1675134 [Panus rudis PR-1116 ss-1]|nr:hypothetical protein K474DRAFT_1675134 [Panus rudis PR-1116 ss-1]
MCFHYLLEKDIIATFNTNTNGVVHATKVFLPLLKNITKTSTVKVLLISSGSSEMECSLESVYCSGDSYSIQRPWSSYVKTKDELCLKSISIMESNFHAGYPSWDGKPQTSAGADKLVLGLLDKFTSNDSGIFLSQHGGRNRLQG